MEAILAGQALGVGPGVAPGPLLSNPPTTAVTMLSTVGGLVVLGFGVETLRSVQ